VRPHNEDAYLVFRTGRTWQRLMTSLPEGQLPERFEECGYGMAVADGMGGHRAGEVASNMALRTAVAVILNNPHWSLKLDNPVSRVKEIEQTINRGAQYFRAIHQAICDRARGDPTLASMGTTLTATYSFGADLFVMHVGDSRAYLWRKSELRQLTRDHTIAQEMADSGALSAEEAAGHRLSHVLTRAIGGGAEEIETSVEFHELHDGDVIFLCTDGLTNMVSDRAIASVLENGLPSDQACRALVERALDAGGKDNVTVVMAKYHLPPRAR
jgi:protein phosphatase